jgi:hypothetical protein
MVAGECGQKQARELIADRLAQAERSRRRDVLQLVQAGAVLEEERKATAGVERGGVHDPHIGHDTPPGDPSPE